MNNQGALARLRNLWQGFLTLWISRREKNNPEAVYEAAIAEKLEQYNKLKKAVAGIVYLRNKQVQDLQQKSKKLKEIQDQIAVAVDKQEDEIALVLIQSKDTLEADLARLQEEIKQTESDDEEAKNSLIQFQSVIYQLKQEKERMLAKLATAKARQTIMHQLDSFSPEADIRALETVRDHIGRVIAEVEVANELNDQSLTAKIRQIKSETATTAAKAQLEELKKARQAPLKAAKQEQAKVQKTI